MKSSCLFLLLIFSNAFAANSILSVGHGASKQDAIKDAVFSATLEKGGEVEAIYRVDHHEQLHGGFRFKNKMIVTSLSHECLKDGNDFTCNVKINWSPYRVLKKRFLATDQKILNCSETSITSLYDCYDLKDVELKEGRNYVHITGVISFKIISKKEVTLRVMRSVQGIGRNAEEAHKSFKSQVSRVVSKWSNSDVRIEGLFEEKYSF